MFFEAACVWFLCASFYVILRVCPYMYSIPAKIEVKKMYSCLWGQKVALLYILWCCYPTFSESYAFCFFFLILLRSFCDAACQFLRRSMSESATQRLGICDAACQFLRRSVATHVMDFFLMPKFQSVCCPLTFSGKYFFCSFSCLLFGS